MYEIVLRLVFSLAVVIGLLLLIARVAQKRLRGGNGALIRVVARQPLSRSSAIAVVNVADRMLVLGATENGISLLTELDVDSLEVEPLDAGGIHESAEHGSTPAQGTFDTTSISTQVRETGPLAGSILSPQTWKQAMTAAQRGHRTAGNETVES